MVVTMAGCASTNGSTPAPDVTGGKTPDATTPVSTSYGPTDIGGRPAAESSKGDGFFDGIADFFGGSKDMAECEAVADVEPSMAVDGYYESAAEGGAAPAAPVEPSGEPIESEFETDEQIQPEAGLLTGGEWRDNDHWADWNALYNSRGEWIDYKTDWRIGYDFRIAVKVTANGTPVEGAKVTCGSAANSAVTDNKGMAYLFCSAINGATEQITAEFGGTTASADGVIGDNNVEIDLGTLAPTGAQKMLDFMIMCDTTGSMSDELSYLQQELMDIVTRVKSDNANIPTRLSINFYRDEGDEYIVREYPFTTDIDAACDAIAQQNANGGGDFPEAVHTALDSALNNHDWDENSVKIMFLVLDAPPHMEDAQVVDQVNSLVLKASEMGVRIIPIASSGIDKSTEYLLRTMAFTTGGTYTFLTNDSGIGGGHIEPTVGAYNVEKLNDMMVRIVNGYLA